MLSGVEYKEMIKKMKKVILAFLLMVVSISAIAQSSNEVVLKFLGIPVDGPKEEMISKLKAKGFKYDTYQEKLIGEFNGKNVDVYLHATHNKVDRVFVRFPFTSEENIKAEYNRLLSQFENNTKYADLTFSNQKISDDEDISFEISVHKKRYQASFYYVELSQDMLLETMLKAGKASMGRDEFEQYKQKMEYFHSLSDSAKTAYNGDLLEEYYKSSQVDTVSAMADADKFFKTLESIIDAWPGQVWFMISEQYGHYCICLYYDNMLNKPNGDDL